MLLTNATLLTLRACIASLLVVASIGCSGRVTIDMDDKVPPTFTFKRNFDEVNYIPWFYVAEVDPENLNTPSSQRKKDDKMIWEIEPLTSVDGEIKHLSPITYGTVPPRFTQRIPNGEPPPKLVEGKTYEAGGPGIMVPKGFLRFTVRGGKAYRVPIPGHEL